MRLLYITVRTPWGTGETFILPEILEALAQGHSVKVVPLRPGRVCAAGGRAARVAEHTLRLPLLNPGILAKAAVFSLRHPFRVARLLGAIGRRSGGARKATKNLAVIPKALSLSLLLKPRDFDHIHAHWASTTATLAWALSELTGIPWSFTLHRWDIAENNMLRLKVEKARFARCIAEDGRNEVLEIVGRDLEHKVKVLHLGVPVPGEKAGRRKKEEPSFTIACPANFVPKKGHRYLVEACAELVKRGITGFQALLFGDGPLEEEIREQIKRLGLEEIVKLPGRLPHDRLMRLYSAGSVDAVVLPSIKTETGEKEGIPVALMEAMAWGIPVITTDTGGTHELVGGGAGIVVPQRDSVRLAEAIESLMRDRELAGRLAEAGRRRVDGQFNIVENTRTLLAWIKENPPNPAKDSDIV